MIEDMQKKDLAPPKNGKSPSRFTKSRVGKFGGGAKNHLKASATSSNLQNSIGVSDEI